MTTAEDKSTTFCELFILSSLQLLRTEILYAAKSRVQNMHLLIFDYDDSNLQELQHWNIKY